LVAFYLAWLACACEEDQEPPVPAGLKDLVQGLEGLAELYEIDLDLLAAAAENSPEAPAAAGAVKPIEVWLSRQKAGDLRELAARLLGDGAAACRAEALARIRDETQAPTWPLAEPTRTLGELRERAEQLRQARLDRERQAREAARRKRLASMAANPKKAIAAIEALVETRSTQKYEQAARELADFREALGPDDGPEKARVIADRLRKDYSKHRGLVSALRKHGLVD
jgi:hypothetical protein